MTPPFTALICRYVLAAAFLVATTIIIFTTSSLFLNFAHSLHQTEHATSDPKPLTARFRHNLIYWTPPKTGSTSMRIWLKEVGENAGLNVEFVSAFRFARFTTFHERVGQRNCSVLMGHIRTIEVDQREHEGSLGAVVTTSRDVMNTYASRYFHRTAQGQDDIPLLADINSPQSRYWFFYFNDLDPCEQLRYYDGKDGCDLETVRERVQRIAERIDCVVDTDDPEQDTAAICRMMKSHDCPSFPTANNANHRLYEDMFNKSHVLESMQRVLHVGNILREQLLKRRCRFLVKGDELSKRNVPLPQWPFQGCLHP